MGRVREAPYVECHLGPPCPPQFCPDLIGLGDLTRAYTKAQQARQQLESGEGPALALSDVQKKSKKALQENLEYCETHYWVHLYQLDFLQRLAKATGKNVVINDYDPAFTKDTKDIHKHALRSHTVHVEAHPAPLKTLIQGDTLWFDANTETNALPVGFNGNNAPFIITGHADWPNAGIGTDYEKHVSALTTHVKKNYETRVPMGPQTKGIEPADVLAFCFSVLYVRK